MKPEWHDDDRERRMSRFRSPRTKAVIARTLDLLQSPLVIMLIVVILWTLIR